MESSNDNVHIITVSSNTCQCTCDQISHAEAEETKSDVSTLQPEVKVANNNNTKEMETFECSICLETKSKSQNYIITQCKHEFCSTCLLKHMSKKNACPLCRSELVSSNMNHFVPLTLREASEITRVTFDNMSFDSEFNAIIAFNDIEILESTIKTVTLQCIRNILQAQRTRNNFVRSARSNTATSHHSDEYLMRMALQQYLDMLDNNGGPI